MGIFNKIFKDEKNDEGTSTMAVSNGYNGPSLNLEKGTVLNLSKMEGLSELIHVGAGWDTGFDLDLCAYLVDDKGNVFDTIYYGHKKATGIYLDQDNLTGEGEGDDENIHVNTKKLSLRATQVFFSVVIYNAANRKQQFNKVKNAFIRLEDEKSKHEICRFNLSNDGGMNTAVIAACLYKDVTTDEWKFKGIEEYSRDSISTLKSKVLDISTRIN